MNEKELIHLTRQYGKIAHHTPGRIRFKFSTGIISKLKNVNLAEIESVWSNSPAILSFRANVAGFTFIVEYDMSRISSELWERVFRDGDEGSTDSLIALLKQTE